jgi:hypothetical protein
MIELRLLALEDQEWDRLCGGFPGFTFFDSAAWLDTFAYKVSAVRRLAFQSGGTCVAAISIGVVDGPDARRFRIPFSASFGGLLYAPDLGMEALDEVVRALLGHLRELAGGKPFSLDYVQRPRYVSGHPRYDAEEFALLRNGLTPAGMQLEYYLDLDELHYSKKLRNELRGKQELSFAPACMEDFLVFREHIVRQQDKIKTIPDEEMRVMGERFADRIRVYKASHEGRTAAMLLSDELNAEVAMGRNWFQDADLSRLGATAFIVSEWINDLRHKGFLRAGFGATATLDGELRPGFLFFKERFRPKAALRRQYHYSGTGV